MYGKSALKAFKSDAVDTASPNKLLVMLFERMCLDIARAEVAQRSSDWGKAHENLTHAQSIISALQEALDPSWEGARDTADLYHWLYGQLVTANLSRNPEVTKECLEIAEPLCETWQQAAVLAGGNATQSRTA